MSDEDFLQESSVAVEDMPETVVRPRHKEEEQEEKKTDDDKKTKRQPPYNVLLMNDDDHTVDYVVEMCKKLFGHPVPAGLKIAEKVHNEGRAIVWTGTMELAELKQEQIHAYGADPRISRCKGSMSAMIEPAA